MKKIFRMATIDFSLHYNIGYFLCNFFAYVNLVSKRILGVSVNVKR